MCEYKHMWQPQLTVSRSTFFEAVHFVLCYCACHIASPHDSRDAPALTSHLYRNAHCYLWPNVGSRNLSSDSSMQSPSCPCEKLGFELWGYRHFLLSSPSPGPWRDACPQKGSHESLGIPSPDPAHQTHAGAGIWLLKWWRFCGSGKWRPW